MKLPKPITRFLIATTVLVVLGASASWWVTWPERTAREFIEVLKRGDHQQVNAVIGFERDHPTYNLVRIANYEFYDISNPRTGPRSWTDKFLGRVNIECRGPFRRTTWRTVFLVELQSISSATQ